MSHQDPVTRLCVSTVNLNTGLSFKIVHDLDESVWASQFNRWMKKTKLHTPGSLISWIKERKPFCICVTKAQFDEMTAGKSTPATKEEWEAENPAR